ncbi:chromate transporter [Orrella sp. 11846]|uniref:chromate transporter n=1 Tax=Orrella sp. 11846 TaxID=3409913 RepID=UPI003B5BC381
MNLVPEITLSALDWWALAERFLLLSILSVGGPLILVPEMRRFLVVDQGWVNDSQVAASVALAQSAPGPNVLFVALLGWNVGLNAGSYWLGLLAAMLTMVCLLLPSSVLLYAASHWIHRNGNRLVVRAFKHGMSPVVSSMLVASGWMLATAGTEVTRDWGLWLLSAATVVLVLKTRLPMVVLILFGGIIGAFSVVFVS